MAAAAAQSEAQEPREAFFDWRKGQKAHGSGKIVVSRGDTLDDLVARMRQRLDMAVCITVEPEHGLGDGLGNLFASRNLIIDYVMLNHRTAANRRHRCRRNHHHYTTTMPMPPSLTITTSSTSSLLTIFAPHPQAARHRPVLRYQFSRMAVPNAHDERGYSQFDDHLFYSSGEGVGCKRNGEDGPKNGQRNCLVGHGSGPGSATIKTFGSTRRILQDGDTLTFCLDHSLRDPTRMAQAAIDKPRLLYDYSATRNALLQAYWADHPQRDLRTPYLKMRRRGELAVVVHFRNGDTSGAKPGASGHRAERYSRDDRGYQEPMAPVVKLPTDCARVFLLTERAADKHVLRFVSWFEEQSRGPP